MLVKSSDVSGPELNLPVAKPKKNLTAKVRTGNVSILNDYPGGVIADSTSNYKENPFVK